MPKDNNELPERKTIVKKMTNKIFYDHKIQLDPLISVGYGGWSCYTLS
jgi:hypothetical protein